MKKIGFLVNFFRNRKSKLSNFLLFLSAVFFTLVCGEVLLRVLGLPHKSWTVPPPATINPYKENPYIIKGRPFLFTHIPGSVYTQKSDMYEVSYRINSRGFRGPEVNSHPPTGMKRLLIIGDSMVEGAGVAFSKTFSMLLNQALAPHGWEVINSGIQGASPIYFAANIPRYLDMHPDAVMLVLFDNDISDDYCRSCYYRKEKFIPDAGSKLLIDRASSIFTLRLGQIIRRVLNIQPVDRIWPHEITSKFEEVFNRHQEENPLFRPGFQFEIGNHVVAIQEWNAAWEISRDYLNLFVDIMQSREILVQVVLLSLGYRIRAATSRQKNHAEMLNESAKKWALQREAPFLSLADSLDAELNVEGCPTIIFPKDGHLNEKGHRLVAQILIPWLLEQLNSKLPIAIEVRG